MIEEAGDDAGEWTRARLIRFDAARVVERAMKDAREGRPLDLTEAATAAAEIVASLERDPHALLAATRLRAEERYTVEHGVAVAALLAAAGRTVGVTGTRELRAFALGGLLHDIGKACMPEAVLDKPAPLTAPESTVMQAHVAEGLALLEGQPAMPQAARAVVAEHHERENGAGYPDGLRGADISLAGRLAALCDVYDALTADTCYRRAAEPSLVLRRLLARAGTDFDPGLTRRFVRAIGLYPVGTLVGMQSGRLAVVIRPDRRGLSRPVVRTFYDTRSQTFTSPRDIDLATDPAADAIIAYELAERWGVSPQEYLVRAGTGT